jgi:hypothetical protein
MDHGDKYSGRGLTSCPDDATHLPLITDIRPRIDLQMVMDED